MDNKLSYSQVRQNLKKSIDDVVDNNTVLVIERKKGENAVMLSYDNYLSMEETIYLVSNNANLKHLGESLKDLENGNIVEVDLDSI